MKNIRINSFALVVVMLLFAFSALGQKTYLNENNTPNQIKEFVHTHFPNHVITKVKKEVNPLKTKYELKLHPKVEIEFDENFNIIELESKNGIPLATLPVELQKYFKNNDINVLIKEWEKKEEGHKVKLLDGRKLYFNNKGDFVGEKNKGYY